MISDLKPIEELDKAGQKLVARAMQARRRAYAPYSKFLVGCVIVDTRGKSHSGCNVENASFPTVLCGEAVAIGKMVSRKGREDQTSGSGYFGR